MGERIKKLKKIRIHREGTNELLLSALALACIGSLLWYSFSTTIPFWLFVIVFGSAWMMALNFYRCPIRYYNGDTDKLVVAPADGKIVVVEEAEENEYFHDKRLMISIFMSPLNVHANWFPVDGKVKFVHHQNGNYHKAWLPKASEENEHSDIMITTADGEDILVRQIAVQWLAVSSLTPRKVRSVILMSTWDSSNWDRVSMSICRLPPGHVSR